MGRKSVGRLDVGEWRRPRVTLSWPCRGEKPDGRTCLSLLFPCTASLPTCFGAARGWGGDRGVCGWRVLQDEAWEGELPACNYSVEVACGDKKLLL